VKPDMSPASARPRMLRCVRLMTISPLHPRLFHLRGICQFACTLCSAGAFSG
jgi:hypothetical protein